MSELKSETESETEAETPQIVGQFKSYCIFIFFTVLFWVQFHKRPPTVFDNIDTCNSVEVSDMMGDETEYLQPVLGTLPSQRFKPLKSTWVAAILLLLIVLMEVSGFLSVMFWPQSALKCEPLYLMLYCHAALWILVLFLDHIFKWHHNKLRLEGYLKAYEQMTKFGSLPFYIVSLGNAGLLVMVTVYQQMNIMLERVCGPHWDSPCWVALAIVSVELILLSYILIVYLVNVRRFNAAKAPPDVSSPDTWEAFTNHEVGYRERGEDVQELLQKQADSIRYYKDAIEVLQRKVMGLTAQLRGDTININ